MNSSQSAVKLNLSSPIYQTPIKRGQPGITKAPSAINMFKQEQTVNLDSRSKRDNMKEVRDIADLDYRDICCPNCRYLFKASVTTEKQDDLVSKIRNMRTIEIQTQEDIHKKALETLNKKLLEMSVQTAIQVLSSQQVQTYTSTKPIEQQNSELQRCKQQLTACRQVLSTLAEENHALKLQLNILTDFVQNSSRKTELPSHLKHLELAH